MLKIGINGFGRIGRLVLRALLEKNETDLKVLAINDLGSLEQNIHLLKYDTVHGVLPFETSFRDNIANIGDQEIKFYNKRSPNEIPWEDHGIDIVLECTGIFTKAEDAKKHLKGSVKKVLISAPASNADITVVYGVNDKLLEKKHEIISNASCTTNCLAPIAKVLHDHFIIEEGLMTTVHATTATQFTVDGPSKKDFRGGRSSLLNIMPASTGAAKAVTKVIPALEGKLTGMAFRVPTANVSVVDLTVKLSKETSYEEIKSVMRKHSETDLKNILGYTEEPVVSQDFVGDIRTSIFDAGAGMELNSKFFKIISWYDNEFGYSNKLIDLAKHINQL